jgi:putative tricarboxylic transport membrane protein
MSSHPENTIEIIAGTPPGGGQDRAARALAAALQTVLSVEVIVTNVPGRGGSFGWAALVARATDPNVISISSPTLITNRLLGLDDLDASDITPIANLYTEYIMFAVPSSSHITTPAELATEIGSPTPPITALATERGNVNHIALGWVAQSQGADPSRVPIRVFESARHAIADTLAGHAGIVAVSAHSMVPEFSSGSVRPIAVSAPRRLTSPFHEVPSWTEAGVDSVIGTWRGVIAPPGLDPSQSAFWDRTIRQAIATETWQQSLDHHGWTDAFSGPNETKTFFDHQTIAMEVALRELGFI